MIPAGQRQTFNDVYFLGDRILVKKTLGIASFYGGILERTLSHSPFVQRLPSIRPITNQWQLGYESREKNIAKMDSTVTLSRVAEKRRISGLEGRAHFRAGPPLGWGRQRLYGTGGIAIARTALRSTPFGTSCYPPLTESSRQTDFSPPRWQTLPPLSPLSHRPDSPKGATWGYTSGTHGHHRARAKGASGVVPGTVHHPALFPRTALPAHTPGPAPPPLPPVFVFHDASPLTLPAQHGDHDGSRLRDALIRAIFDAAGLAALLPPGGGAPPLGPPGGPAAGHPEGPPGGPPGDPRGASGPFASWPFSSNGPQSSGAPHSGGAAAASSLTTLVPFDYMVIAPRYVIIISDGGTPIFLSPACPLGLS